MSGEKTSNQHEISNDQAELERKAEDVGEQIRQRHDNLETSVEKKGASEKNEARQEALEQAAISEKSQEKPAETKEGSPEKHTRGKRNKRELDNSYKEIMKEARTQMPATNRAFSKLIHNRAVESTSEAIGSTIARPNAVLTGSVSAFIIVLGVYLVARYYGYPLSGSETLIAFAAGWLIGIMFDFFRTMITGKR